MHAFFSFFQGPFHDIPIRIILALCTGHLIIAVGSSFGFFEVMFINGYGQSLTGSFFIALLLVQMVNSVTGVLHVRLPFVPPFKKRIVMQFIFGVGLVIPAAYLLACLLFKIFGYDIDESQYVNTDFPLIVTFILLLNIYYCCFDYHLNQKALLLKIKYYHRKKVMLEADESLNTIDLQYLNVAETDLAFVYREKGLSILHFINQTNEAKSTSISIIKESLPDEDYFMINNYCIVHRLLIYKYEAISSRRYRLFLRKPFEHYNNKRQVEVSQDFSKNFLRWYKD